VLVKLVPRGYVEANRWGSKPYSTIITTKKKIAKRKHDDRVNVKTRNNATQHYMFSESMCVPLTTTTLSVAQSVEK
jgi:hypothetical protein